MSLLYGAGNVKARYGLYDTVGGTNDLSPVKNYERRAAAPRAPRLLFISAALLLLAAESAPARAVARQAASPRSLIVTASGVRLRERPEAGAAEVARLPLGAVVAVQERAAEKSKVGAAEDYWYLVAATGGGRGWVFGGLAAPFDPARREEIYRAVAAERVARADATFAELSDLVRFLDRATKEVKGREAQAELELARLVALARSLASFSIEDQEKSPYKSWTVERAREIVYSEPAGQWYVRAELFWGLQSRYKDLPVAERAAWEAAQTPLPGECEGYLPCHLGSLTMTSGRYLKLYPRGPHAGAALEEIAELLGHVTEDMRRRDPVFHVPREDRADFRKTVAELRGQVASAASPKKAPLLRRLDAIARRFR